MDEITIVVCLIFGILQIILFFKIWGMTNNVKRILNIFEEVTKEKRLELETAAKKAKYNNATENAADKFNIGDLVVDSNGIQWRVAEINGVIVVCKNSTKGIVEYAADEISLFK